MKSFFSLLRQWIHFDLRELINNLIIRPNIKDHDAIKRFLNLNQQYDHICQKYYDTNITLQQNSIGYDWGSWSGKIRKSFKKSLPINFLDNPLISFTMVFQRNKGVKQTEARISNIKKIFNLDLMQKILLEDYIGCPTISNSFFKTSANRAHHTLHLASYFQATKKYFWESSSIIEFGGGYGNMARLIRKMNPNLTYIIVDLPELLALQYVYLGSLESEENLNIISSKSDSIKIGKINLISSNLIYSNEISIHAESFISTWALSECPNFLQKFVIENDFFSASNILIASLVDANNCMVNLVENKNLSTIKVPFLNGNHEYWMR